VSRHWFDGGNPIPLIKPGTLDERARARLGAARLVARNHGTADDLRLILSSLDLWPASDTATLPDEATCTPPRRLINGR